MTISSPHIYIYYVNSLVDKVKARQYDAQPQSLPSPENQYIVRAVCKNVSRSGGVFGCYGFNILLLYIYVNILIIVVMVG